MTSSSPTFWNILGRRRRFLCQTHVFVLGMKCVHFMELKVFLPCLVLNIVYKKMLQASCDLGSSDNALTVKHKESWDINNSFFFFSTKECWNKESPSDSNSSSNYLWASRNHNCTFPLNAFFGDAAGGEHKGWAVWRSCDWGSCHVCKDFLNTLQFMDFYKKHI